jgi:hypothetical protein
MPNISAIAPKSIDHKIIRSRQQHGPAPANLSKADLELFLRDLPQQLPNLGLIIKTGNGENDFVAINLRDLPAFLEKELGIKDPQQRANAFFSLSYQIITGKKRPGSKGSEFNRIAVDAQEDLIGPSTDIGVQSKFCAKFKQCKNQKSWASLFTEPKNPLAANPMNLQNAYNAPQVTFDESSPEAKPNIEIKDQLAFAENLVEQGIISKEALQGLKELQLLYGGAEA